MTVGRRHAEEYSYPGYTDDATANPGESFMSGDGASWVDATDVNPTLNFCIKALGNPGGGNPPVTPTRSSGGSGGGCDAGLGLMALAFAGFIAPLLRKRK
jgi:hypothetical protein